MTGLTRHLLATAAVARRRLEREAIEEVRKFLRGQQQDDGGFSGRDGRSDLYYTVFGAGALLALGSRPAFRIRRYLSTFDAAEPTPRFADPSKEGNVPHPDRSREVPSREGQGVGSGAGGHGLTPFAAELDFVHLACLIRCRAAMHSRRRSLSALLRQLERYRSCDGAYAHTETGCATGTPYASYLALLAYEDAGVSVPESDRLLQAVQRPAFALGRTPTTPGTAAVVTISTHLNGTPPRDAVDWLLEQAVESSGFRASPAAPVADLLSTATALYALHRLEHIPTACVPRCEAFIEDCWSDSGGFSGHPGDDLADCEYTFYALLALGCLGALDP